MKKIACVTLVLGIVLVSRAVFAEGGPPTIQTPKKDTFVEEKTEQKSQQTLRKRVEISEDGTITIYYEANGDEQNALPQTDKPNEDTATPYSGDQFKAREIMEKFSSVWEKNMGGFPEHIEKFIQAGLLNKEFTKEEYIETIKKLPNILTPEELKTADSLANEYINLYYKHPTRIMEDHYLGYIAALGNRYIAKLDETLNAADRLPSMSFYINYILDSAYEARVEDIPTDEDKRWAIQKLTNAIMQTDVLDFTEELHKEINRLNPKEHSFLVAVLNERKNQ